jgi:hypothetical protein
MARPFNDLVTEPAYSRSMNLSTLPTQLRWNPSVRADNGLDNETRLQAARVMDSVEQMKDAFLALDNSAQDIDSKEQYVWLRDATLSAGGPKVSGSLNDEAGLIAYLSEKPGDLPFVQFEKKEIAGTLTWARRSPQATEQIFQFPNGEMEYFLARSQTV